MEPRLAPALLFLCFPAWCSQPIGGQCCRWAQVGTQPVAFAVRIFVTKTKVLSLRGYRFLEMRLACVPASLCPLQAPVCLQPWAGDLVVGGMGQLISTLLEAAVRYRVPGHCCVRLVSEPMQVASDGDRREPASRWTDRAGSAQGQRNALEPRESPQLAGFLCRVPAWVRQRPPQLNLYPLGKLHTLPGGRANVHARDAGKPGPPCPPQDPEAEGAHSHLLGSEN